MRTYGQKGGTSINAGRKIEVIQTTLAGQTYSKRVFCRQRAITVLQSDPNASPLVQAWADLATAQQYLTRIDRDEYPVQMCGEAAVAS